MNIELFFLIIILIAILTLVGLAIWYLYQKYRTNQFETWEILNDNPFFDDYITKQTNKMSKTIKTDLKKIVIDTIGLKIEGFEESFTAFKDELSNDLSAVVTSLAEQLSEALSNISKEITEALSQQIGEKISENPVLSALNTSNVDMTKVEEASGKFIVQGIRSQMPDLMVLALNKFNPAWEHWAQAEPEEFMAFINLVMQSPVMGIMEQFSGKIPTSKTDILNMLNQGNKTSLLPHNQDQSFKFT